ncbi:MAG: bifunctional diaminohydroxyphosphoribosylaminopyrimidine deaminase/5-amino-6-(5-phosphoribosylamino)uracil reductase RibD [Spirochaetales bacterium]|nr:bifunctional diaminohydroxyphosphoribosylaminopyrimidine deaminase/5-amino-6-(5-phosphoribosylamino)uracil reductase RibD [Spirochaetales bacterium]
MIENHQKFMDLAIEIAAKGGRKTFPNPKVGAIVVKNGKILATGYHHEAGAPHAEVDALNKITGHAEGATLYVSLEPCCHFGKTPPCTERIIKEKIGLVVCAMEDPNPLVAGKGFEALERSGIEVIKNINNSEARELNKEFIHFMHFNKPFVTLKIASTLDGKIATSSGNSKWISGEESRKYVHRLRSEAQAIMVGVNTIIKDDPQLNVRLEKHSEYIPRFILDPELCIPLKAGVLNDDGREITHLITSTTADSDKIKAIRSLGAEVHQLPQRDGVFNHEELLNYLGQMGMISLFIEGGGNLASGFLKHNAVDRFLLFMAPILLGDPDGIGFYKNRKCENITDGIKMNLVQSRQFGQDIFLEYRKETE